MDFAQISQTAIALLSSVAVWLTQMSSPRAQRLAPILGILSQPFWFYSAWTSEQWGVFVACIVCALAWANGLRKHWFAGGQGGDLGTMQLVPESRK